MIMSMKIYAHNKWIPSKDYSNLCNLLTQVLLKEFEEVLSEKASISQQPVTIGNIE